ncbi:MAG: hypothetical protein ACRDE2_17285, partial [Chitinophagaceae bacterium]
MKKYSHFTFAMIFIFFIQNAFAQTSSSPMGFTGNHGQEQLLLEKRFDTALHTQNMDAWMKRISAYPHHVGSPYD